MELVELALAAAVIVAVLWTLFAMHDTAIQRRALAADREALREERARMNEDWMRWAELHRDAGLEISSQVASAYRDIGVRWVEQHVTMTECASRLVKPDVLRGNQALLGKKLEVEREAEKSNMLDKIMNGDFERSVPQPSANHRSRDIVPLDLSREG